MDAEKAAIYHFTDGSEARPIVVRKEINRIMDFACKAGFHETDVFLDTSLRKCRQVKRQEFEEKISSYKALFLKDFYHLRKNTDICMSELVRLSREGIKVFTLEDGAFKFIDAPFSQNLNAAAYYCGLGITEHSSQLQFDIMDSFTKRKTGWRLTGWDADLKGNKTDGNQKELERLVREIGRHDIVLVQSFGHIHWRTSRFCKIRHLLKKGIYSMHEEIFLPYEEGGKQDE